MIFLLIAYLYKFQVKPNWSKLVSHYKRPALVLAIPVIDINAEVAREF
jgi:hypothetical protein